MTWILVLLCLAIAGRELYLAFDRKRPAVPGLADLRARLGVLEGVREELERHGSVQDEQIERLASTQVRQAESVGEADARIRSLIGQINDRMLPEVNARLTQQRESIDRLETEVSRLRDHLVHRLDAAAATSLGADPADTIAGALGSAARPHPDLIRAYERLATQYGMRIELTAPAAYRMPDTDSAWQTRYYLSGRSPRELESDFIDLLGALTTTPDATDTKLDAAQDLLGALKQIDLGGAQLGPLVITRTPSSLVCGVLPLADLLKAEPAALIADPAATTTRLNQLPEGRLHNTATH
jgi:uncharacterized coiled-coil protein SlyX